MAHRQVIRVNTKVAAFCSRCSDNHIRVRFTDEDARSGIEVTFSPADFANFVTGMVVTDVPAEFYDADKVGKVRELKVVDIPHDDKFSPDKKQAAILASLWVEKNFPGWQVDDSFSSQSTFQRQGIIHCRISRFVDREATNGGV